MNILAKLIASGARSKLLSYFIAHEGEEIHLRGLERELGISPRQLTLELQNLTDISFLRERKTGNMKLYRANTAVFYFSALKQFIQSLEEGAGEYLRWERAGAIHPLYPVLDATATYFEDYWGYAWPDNTLIYTEETCLWCVPAKPLTELGQHIVERLWSPAAQNQYIADVRTKQAALVASLLEIGGENLEVLSRDALLARYQQFYDSYTAWWALVVPTSILYLYFESVFDERLAAVAPAEQSVLKAITQKSFSQVIEEGYGELTLIARTQGEESEALLAGAESFRQRFFWMHNNYYETRVLRLDEVLSEVKKRLQSGTSAQAFTDIGPRREALMDQFELDAETRRLLALNDFFGAVHDDRKKWMMQSTHCLERLLAEVGRRAGLSMMEMRYTLPADLPKLLNGEKVDITSRLQRFLIHGDSRAKVIQTYTGEEAELRSRRFLSPGQEYSPAAVVQGKVASPGKAIGIVKVLKNASELYKIRHGDVLVTSMTSPDFVVTMRKIVAVVTNEGGLTCHAAILSREMGLPCIVGTRVATQVLKDGDRVEVDANTGVVTIIG